jgi:hypothetical protein
MGFLSVPPPALALVPVSLLLGNGVYAYFRGAMLCHDLDSIVPGAESLWGWRYK